MSAKYSKGFYTYKNIINQANGKFELDVVCYQLVVYNHTTKIIKLSTTTPDTNFFEFIVNANKVLISPPDMFYEVSWIIDGFVDTRINPIFYAYNRRYFTPGVSSIT